MGVPAKLLTAGLAGCAAVVIAACGSGGSPSASMSSPAQEPGAAALVGAMQVSVRQATSVHIDGHLSNSGTLIGVNLDMHRNGDVSGTVSQNGAAFQIIGVNNLVYIKATPAFLRQVKAPSSACSVLCGKWLQLTAQEANQITGDISMDSLTAPLTSGQVPALSETGSKTVSGQSTWVLRAADGSTLDVSSGSQHFPLAATTGGSAHEVVVYSRWNSVPHPTAPPASQTINLNNLKQ